MTFDQCNGNWNYMYEWRTSSDSDQWYPCHLYDKESSNNNEIYIYTRNGTIMREKEENVRKMSKENYIKNRKESIKFAGKHYKAVGFHDTLEEDLALWKII